MINLFLLLTAIPSEVAAQRITRPEAPLPFCHDLACLQEQKGVQGLELRKKYRNNARPDSNSLKELRWLDLSSNRLELLPDWVCECEKLEYLNLAQNRIQRLPDCIGRLKNLRYLEANRNPLYILPETLSQCHQLQYLDLWKTWVTEIPWALKPLDQSLKMVDLRAIKMTREEQMEIHKVFSNPELRLSAWCNCAPHRPKR